MMKRLLGVHGYCGETVCMFHHAVERCHAAR